MIRLQPTTGIRLASAHRPSTGPRRHMHCHRAGRDPAATMFAATLAVVAAAIFPVGCEEEPPLPPKTPATAPAVPEIDHKHSAMIKADRNLTIPNLRFVIQRDPLGSAMTGFTLLSTRPGAEGARLLLGTTQNVASLDKLTATDIHFGGGRFLDPHGSGIFTATAAYQPKLVTLKITRMTEGEVHGTISGEFYRYKMAAPGVRPAVVQLEATFDALLTFQ